MADLFRNPYAAQVLHGSVEFVPRRLARPLELSTGLITDVTEARTRVTVRAAGSLAQGKSCVYLSDNWAWPNQAIPHADRDDAMRLFTLNLADRLPDLLPVQAHPLELGLQLAAALPGLPEIRGLDLPLLARVVCASPFDAAIHDGVGIATGRSAFNLYDAAVIPTADSLFPESGASRPISAMLSAQPRRTLDAWWIVGRNDACEELASAVARSGYRCFKLKLNGSGADDAKFAARVHAAAVAAGVSAPVISVDYNGACRSPEPVLEFLDHLADHEPATYQALSYIEQPVPGALEAYPADWGLVGQRRPVIVDEGLVTLDALPIIQAQRWTGLALKTAKGHSLCIASAAWALDHGLRLTFQDLTNPGLGAIHSALFAARLPTLNGAEINSPQFTPDANASWIPRLSGLFEPRHGVHLVPDGELPGLGSTA